MAQGLVHLSHAHSRPYDDDLMIVFTKIVQKRKLIEINSVQFTTLASHGLFYKLFLDLFCRMQRRNCSRGARALTC